MYLESKMTSTMNQETILPQSHHNHNGKPHIKPVNGGPILSTSSLETVEPANGTRANGSGGGVKANGSNAKKNGSNIISNGPTHTDTIDINETSDKVSEDGDDGKSVHGARSTDLIFLKSVVLTNTLERPKKKKENRDNCLPVTHDSMRLVDQVRTIAEQRIYLDEANELYTLLTEKWIQALLEVHDEIAAHIQNSLEEVKYIDGVSSNEDSEDEEAEKTEDEKEEKSDSGEEIVDTFRVIGLRRKPGESLGLTVTTDESGKVIVARIIINSVIERQGLLRPGDLILEANNTRVKTPEQLQNIIEESPEFITLKIQPTLSVSQSQPLNSVEKNNSAMPNKYYVRCLFSYDPHKDTLLPCKEIGLPFKYGDILQVVNSSDPSWWQARPEEGDTIGLIPSQDLEERRKCFVEKPDLSSFSKWSSCCGAGKKEKKRFPYHIRKNAEVDTADLQLYEAVEKMAPFTRKVLVLVGPPGVGRHAMVRKIVKHDGKLFDTIKAVTTRPMNSIEVESDTNMFLSHDEFMTAVDRDEFLEVSEHDGYLQGITYQALRSVISLAKLCVIHCNPETLKILHHSPEFLPYVIFLSAPSAGVMKSLADQQSTDVDIISSEDDIRSAIEESNRIREDYQKYFDLEVRMEDMETSFRTIMDALVKLTNESQWVPLNWVYS